MAAARKGEAKIRRLRENAAELMSAQKYDQAVTVYEELSRLDETNGEWARRAADCHWHLKNTDQRLKFSLLAARAYSEAGLLLKAIAMCKVVLSIDPNHQETQQELADLHARGTPAYSRAISGGVSHQPLDGPVSSKTAALSADALPSGTPQRINPLRPSAAENAKRDERTRARMAAAAALRLARAQLKRDSVADAEKTGAEPPSAGECQARPLFEAGKASIANETSPTGITPTAPDKTTDNRVLGRISLKRIVHEVEQPRAAVVSPQKSGAPRPPLPVIPSLRIEPPKRKTASPGLVSLRLSERVPARSMDSLRPSRGNVYSLALGEIPNAELRALRVPDIKLPKLTPDELAYVAVIPPPKESPSKDKAPRENKAMPNVAPPHAEPAPEELLPLEKVLSSEDEPASEPSPDSIDTDNISFDSPLFPDKLDVANKDFGGIPLLSDLPANVLRQLITDVAMVELDTGDVLFNEGDPADAMYTVVEGSVTAITLPHRDKPIQLAHLVEGEFFGEIGLMSDQPRGATVRAHEPTRLLRFDRDIVAVLIDQDPSFLAKLLRFLKERLVDDLMTSSPLFTPFDQDERLKLADQFEFLDIEPDSVLLERGQLPIGMYVLLTGEATMRGASEAGTIRRLGPGDIFGEQALLNNEVSKVEVRTSAKSFALCLPSDAFPEVIVSHPAALEYLKTLSESSKGELDVAEDYLDHIRFF